LKEHKNKSHSKICPVLQTDLYFQAAVIVLSHTAVFPRLAAEIPVLEAGSHFLSSVFHLTPLLHLHKFSSILVLLIHCTTSSRIMSLNISQIWGLLSKKES